MRWKRRRWNKMRKKTVLAKRYRNYNKKTLGYLGSYQLRSRENIEDII